MIISNQTNELKPAIKQKKEKTVSFADFVINGSLDEINSRIGNEIFVLNGLAVQGETTVFYAAPNSGKTLITIKLLRDAVLAGRIDPSKTFYINMDDGMRGISIRGGILNEVGIQVISNYNGFNPNMLPDLINEAIRTGKAEGMVLILDTLKKFTNIMDKSAGTTFFTLLKKFAAFGGTVISLSHTNKHKSSDGKPIAAGTSDSKDDNDCTYSLNIENKAQGIVHDGRNFTEYTVRFENTKNRADTLEQAFFKYKKYSARPEKTRESVAQDYRDLLDSVTIVNAKEVQQETLQTKINNSLNDNQEAIEFVLSQIDSGIHKKTELSKALVEKNLISKSKTSDFLRLHSGDNYQQGHRWFYMAGDKNAQLFYKTEPLVFVPN